MSYTIDASVFVAAARPVEKEHSVSLEFLEQVDQQKLPIVDFHLLPLDRADLFAVNDAIL
jgi:hypothetical protein